MEYSQLTNSVVIVSGEQRKDSDTHIHVSILPQSPLPFKLPHDCSLSPRIELTLLGFAGQPITEWSLQIPENPALASPPNPPYLVTLQPPLKSVIPPCSCLHLSLLGHLSQSPIGTPLSDPLSTKTSNRADNLLWLPHLALLLTHRKHSNLYYRGGQCYKRHKSCIRLSFHLLELAAQK